MRARTARGGQQAHRTSPARLHVVDAADLARTLIPHESKRWRHSRSAAEAAAQAGQVLAPDECRLLVSAAWVHDIGYHHPDPPTGFHPLDGAQLVLDAGWPERMAALVAHHSEARFMAAARGLVGALDRWPRESGPVSDGLVWADMTAAPRGGRVGIRDRLRDIRRRHAREAPERAAARTLREPHLLLAAARVDVALLQGGAGGHRLAFPVADMAHLRPDAVERLASRHPESSATDLAAALHASAGQPRLLDEADRLLVAVQSLPSGG